MLVEIKIKNFYSFRDEVALNFEASKDRFADESQVITINNTRLLRYAIIYGYNASGKTNLLKSFDFLHNFWTSKSRDIEDGTGVTPFRLDRLSPLEPSSFDLIFFVEDTKYNYHLELDERQVYLEKLSYYRSTQPIMLFERKLANNTSVITFNSAHSHADKVSNFVKETIESACPKNISVFVARNQANADLPLIDAAKDWLRKKILRTVYPTMSLFNFAKRLSLENSELNHHILDFLKTADFNVSNILTEEIRDKVDESFKSFILKTGALSESEKKRLLQENTISEIRTYFEHTVENKNGAETYRFMGKDESQGTIRIYGIEAAIFNVMQINGFLPIDEIETSLHPKLVEKLLFEYLNKPVRSQILIATHEDGLLDLTDDLIRKDSVWFTEKKQSGSSDLYRLTEFRGVNRITSIRDAYRNKRFGATMR